MGYDRYDSMAVVKAMNERYRGEIRLMMNLFQPSVNLQRKERVGSRPRRQHDDPQTPLNRLKRSKDADRIKVAVLEHTKAGLNPFDLSDGVDRQLVAIHGLADRRTWPSNTWKAKGNPPQRARDPFAFGYGLKRRDNAAPRLGFLMA